METFGNVEVSTIEILKNNPPNWEAREVKKQL